MNDKTNVYQIGLLILLILFFIFIILFQNTIPTINSPSAQSFITTCNEIYGYGNWSAYRLNPWTTYTDEFWVTHPRVYMDMGVINSDPYSCFDKR